jgi:drug/metabolite transporter (DMT)-like permease
VTLIAMILKQLAFKNDKITRVYPIFYIESVFCLFADLALFHEKFELLQMAGIVMIFTMFAAKMIASQRDSQ